MVLLAFSKRPSAYWPRTYNDSDFERTESDKCGGIPMDLLIQFRSTSLRRSFWTPRVELSVGEYQPLPVPKSSEYPACTRGHCAMGRPPGHSGSQVGEPLLGGIDIYTLQFGF